MVHSQNNIPPVYPEISMPSWYDQYIPMEVDDDFINGPPQQSNSDFRRLGGVPMSVSNSNESGHSVFSNISSASSNTMSSYGSPVYESSGFSDGFSHMSIAGHSPYQYSNSTQSQIPTQTIRHTPSSLGWPANPPVHEHYDLVLEKFPKGPYLKRRLGGSQEIQYDTFTRPPIVHFETDESQPSKSYHPCRYPSTGCWKSNTRPIFKRTADLERHYNIVHHASEEKIPCDYPKCSRHLDPFTRKDHCRDHYREFHKEDHGAYKGGKSAKGGMDRKKWETKQREWEAERRYDLKWWRCSKCLDRVYFDVDQWMCNTCKKTCEGGRITTRLALAKEQGYEGDRTRYEGMAGYEDVKYGAGEGCKEDLYTDCANCHDNGYVVGSNGWYETCHACSGYAPQASSSGQHNGMASGQQWQYDGGAGYR